MRRDPAATQDWPGPDLDDLAYLISRPGSTGRPRACSSITAASPTICAGQSAVMSAGDRLTYALFTSLAFDLTITSLFLPLITGGTLEIYPEPTARSTRR